MDKKIEDALVQWQKKSDERDFFLIAKSENNVDTLAMVTTKTLAEMLLTAANADAKIGFAIYVAAKEFQESMTEQTAEKNG